ncbi:MAG: 3-deoxy-8-phosphooctulonate synthase [Spirochaetes bacterium]|nr:3-deoxy-8-phosphooctulonate synthase [Spirochaetota bacterium]
MIIKSREINIGSYFRIGGDNPLAFILGPCVIENEIVPLKIAEKLKELSDKYHFNFIFKASFDKANRTSYNSFRGVGLEKGINILKKVKEEFNIPVLTDIHESYQAKIVSEVVDVIQIPAFLIRQTDLVYSAAITGKVLNLKKAQFLSPFEMEHVVNKVLEAQNNNFFITDRGTFFGYNRLVNDFKYFPIYKKFAPLCLDVTHSCQLPGMAKSSGGEPEYIDNLSYAGVASYVDLLFFETHFSRKESKSDSSNLILLDDLEKLIPKLIKLGEFVRKEIF